METSLPQNSCSHPISLGRQWEPRKRLVLRRALNSSSARLPSCSHHCLVACLCGKHNLFSPLPPASLPARGSTRTLAPRIWTLTVRSNMSPKEQDTLVYRMVCMFAETQQTQPHIMCQTGYNPIFGVWWKQKTEKLPQINFTKSHISLYNDVGQITPDCICQPRRQCSETNHCVWFSFCENCTRLMETPRWPVVLMGSISYILQVELAEQWHLTHTIPSHNVFQRDSMERTLNGNLGDAREDM